MPIYSIIEEAPLDTRLGARVPGFSLDESQALEVARASNLHLDLFVPRNPTPEQLELRERVTSFLVPISHRFVSDFEYLLSRNTTYPCENGSLVPESIRNRLRARSLLYPKFLFAQGDYANRVYRDFSSIADEPFMPLSSPECPNIAVFQLPPPLAIGGMRVGDPFGGALHRMLRVLYLGDIFTDP